MVIHGLLILFIGIVTSQPTTCRVPFSGGGDDSYNVINTFRICNQNSIIIFDEFPYYFGSPIAINGLNDVEIRINGNISYPSDINYVQSLYSKYPIYTVINGTNIRVIGSTDPKWGWIDAHGQQWWNKNILINRPRIIGFTVTNGFFSNFKIYQSIAQQFFLIQCSNVTVTNFLFESISSNATAFPFNTDGICILDSHDILIENTAITNGDDCVVVNNGSHNLHIRNITCTNSHGISIGSLGLDPTLPYITYDILVEDCKMYNSLYCARVKSWKGGKGKANRIRYNNFLCQNGTIPILVTQEYIDQNNPGNHTGNFSIWWDDVTFENFEGTIKHPGGDGSGNWWNTNPATNDSTVVVIQCFPGDNQCTNLHFGNLSFKTELPGIDPQVICQGIPPTENIGMKCYVGPYEPTTLPLQNPLNGVLENK